MTATGPTNESAALEALKLAFPYMRAAYMDMLCKAGGYSERALKNAMESSYWKTLEADVKTAQATLIAHGVDPKTLHTAA